MYNSLNIINEKLNNLEVLGKKIMLSIQNTNEQETKIKDLKKSSKKVTFDVDDLLFLN